MKSTNYTNGEHELHEWRTGMTRMGTNNHMSCALD